MRCIVFVERKLTSLALQYLIWKLKLSSVTDVGYCYSANSDRNVNDPREREEVNKEKQKMKDTIGNSEQELSTLWCLPTWLRKELMFHLAIWL